jgi:DNA-binding Lrp family transcriptional regulator
MTQPKHPLDATDHRIVALLRADSKRTLAEIGDEVGLSATAVKRRVDRLERDEVILGYGARINARALGGGVDAMVEVYCADRTAPTDVARSLAGVEEVVYAATVSGEADAVLHVRTESIEHMEKVVERLRRDHNIVRTRTMIVLSTIIDRPH